MQTAEQLKKIYYDGYAKGLEEERLFLDKAHHTEYIITNKYLSRYLKESSKIIDIGAGAGAYSKKLAEQGYTVDALDLHPVHVERLNENLSGYENARAFLADATDLSQFEDNSYDIVLLLGPLYHIQKQADRLKALSEAVRVVKTGGVIFAAFILQDAPLIQYIFQSDDPVENLKCIGYDRERAIVTENTGSAIIVDTIASVDGFTDKACKTLPIAKGIRFAQDGLSQINREYINKMSDEAYAEWIQYLYATAERPELMGYSNHIVQIFIKK